MSTMKILNHLRQVQYHPSLQLQYINKQTPLLLFQCTKCISLQTSQVRYYQRPPQKEGLFSKFMENIKEGMKRDKQLQDNLKKFQTEAKKVEESQALKDAKAKFSVFGQIKETVSPISSKLEETVKETGKAASSTFGKIYKDAVESDIFKKGQEVSEEESCPTILWKQPSVRVLQIMCSFSKSAKEAASKLSKQQQELEKSDTYKSASEAFSKVREDLFDDIAKESRPYQRPDKLKRRTQHTADAQEIKIEANEDAQDVVLHKDSKWQQQWKDFRDNNPVVTGLFTLKTKYDESDNVMIRATRVVTDKLTDVFSDVFSQSEQAQTIAEIAKIDPSFNKDTFIKECEFEIIPTVLEGYLRGDVEVLQDWCHEGAFNVLSTQIKHNQSIGMVNASKILDIRDVELVIAKVMDQGPVLIMTFQAQQVNMMKNTKGDIVEGAVDNIENINYVWAMCRDQAIFDHRQAWRVLEFGIQQATPYL